MSEIYKPSTADMMTVVDVLSNDIKVVFEDAEPPMSIRYVRQDRVETIETNYGHILYKKDDPSHVLEDEREDIAVEDKLYYYVRHSLSSVLNRMMALSINPNH